MWHEFIHSLDSTAQFAQEASEAQILESEGALGVRFPEDLKTLLYESNGVRDHYGFCIVWSLEEITQYNGEMRLLPQYSENYSSFAELLFFADAGNGDRFAFPVLQREAQQGPVLAWNHEDDMRKEVASSLQFFLEGWLNGNISV